MLRIDWPAHGTILNHRHGKQDSDGLTLQVRGHAPAGVQVRVNGEEASRTGDAFRAVVTLRDTETDIQATCTTSAGTQQHSTRVVWDRDSFKRYRFSIDDGCYFLRDITREKYASIFDCHFLRILKNLNDAFGTKFSVNLFFTTPDQDFALNEMPNTYRAEWAENSSWLKLAWHAYAEFPNRPYQYALPAKMAADIDCVANEILRFAGEEAYAPPTVVHWGMGSKDTMPVLRERGCGVLSGLFRPTRSGYDVNYYLDDHQCEHLAHHDALMDFDAGMIFSMVDIICNCTSIADTVPVLKTKMENPDTAEVMDLFTHEQYFWPFYVNYVPDHAKRLETALRYVTEQGYKPVFFHEGYLG